MAQHGSARVSGAPEGAGGDGLDAVEELERSAGSEENDRSANHVGVSGVDASDVAWENEKSHAHASHKGGTKKNGGVARIASAGWVAAADGLADADGGGGRDSEGHHVGEGDGVESDLVRGKRNGAETRNERGDQSKDADFRRELKRGWETKSDQAADALQVGLHRGLEKFGFVPRVVPEEVGHEDKREVGAGDSGGDTRTGDAESGEAQFAEDEGVVTQDVDEVCSDESEGDGRTMFMPWRVRRTAK